MVKPVLDIKGNLLLLSCIGCKITVEYHTDTTDGNAATDVVSNLLPGQAVYVAQSYDLTHEGIVNCVDI